MSRRDEQAWRDYRADVAATRAEAGHKLAPRPAPKLSPRAAAALARARKQSSRRV